MGDRRSHAIALLGFVATGSVGLHADAAAVFDTVALSESGGRALGFGPNQGSGVNFSTFGTPSLNSAGDVVFAARMAGVGVAVDNDTGLFTSLGSAPVNAIAREAANGALGPDTWPDAVVFADLLEGVFQTPVINDAGQVAFRAQLAGVDVDSTNNTGIFLSPPGGAASSHGVARQGAPGPGPNVEPGTNFAGFSGSIFAPALNGSGTLAFTELLTGPGVDQSNNSGIFRATGGTIAPVARAGPSGPGPNLGPGVNFSNFFNSLTTLNNAGDIAFTADLSGSGVDNSTRAGIFQSVGGGPVTALARSGNAGLGPNLGAGVYFTNNFPDPRMNASGRIAFSTGLVGAGVDGTNDQGVFTNVGGTLHAVARSGPAGPGPNLLPGQYFQSVSLLSFNDPGDVAFVAFLAGDLISSANDRALFTTKNGVVTILAREGVASPGPNLGPGITFSDFLGPSVFNSAGTMVFGAHVTGPGVNASNDEALFTNANGPLEAFLREGDLFDVDPGPGVSLRTIASFDVYSEYGGGMIGQPDAFNDAGLLTFGMTFTDGTSGIFTAAVPEPASIAAFLVVAGGAALRRRRRHRS